MAKGRKFVPSTEKDGVWFQTRGWSQRFDDTRQPEKRVPDAPSKFEEKAEVPYKRFAFSQHDNRNAFQDKGEYFGNGLGKKMLLDRRQHYSNNLISWQMPMQLRSCYSASYRGQQGEDSSPLRRFPRQHPEGTPGTAPLNTTTTAWFREPDIPHRTPLHVLAVTQRPFLRPNKWTYSYRPVWS